VEFERNRILAELEGITEVPARQGRVLEFLESDPAEGDVNPEVFMTSGQGIPEGIARGFGVAGLPDLDPFLVIELDLADLGRVIEFIIITAEPRKR
jgi:hypothetical protein